MDETPIGGSRKRAVALGLGYVCLLNAVVFLGIAAVYRISGGNFLALLLINVFGGVQLIYVVPAMIFARKKPQGFVIGMILGASLMVLLNGACWASPRVGELIGRFLGLFGLR
jgi:hypothetical protein